MDTTAHGTLSAAARRRLLRVVLYVACVLAALVFRLKAVESYRAPAGDGVQYYQLAEELRRADRFAFAPPAPLTYARLPGYPLFLAYVASPGRSVSLARHLVAATRWNALFDVASALLAFCILRKRRLPGGLAAFFAVVTCPILVYLSMYGLTESLTTFLLTLGLWLVLRAEENRPLLHMAAAGAAVGFAQLMRADAVSFAPVALLGALFLPLPARKRLLAAGVFLLGALAVFAPWPLRNLARFSAPHPLATTWLSQSGQPLPLGMLHWMQTWATGSPGESYLLFLIAVDRQIDPERPGILRPSQYDSPEERAAIVELFARYNRERLSPAVDAGFRALARERARRAPLRTFVRLPLQRLVTLWSPMPEHELPVRSKLLGLPQSRARYAHYEQGLLVLSALGALWLLFCGGHGGAARRLALLVLVLAAGRSAIPAIIHPFPVERYVAPVFPAVLMIGAGGVCLMLRWLWTRLPLAREARR